MNWKIELVAIPVTDVNRAKAFYVDQVGFHADHDYQVNDDLRFVQLTPPGSACSVVLGTGITEMPPGSQKGVQMVVEDAAAARQELIGRGVQASEVERAAMGIVRHLRRPGRQHLGLAAAAATRVRQAPLCQGPAMRPVNGPGSAGRGQRAGVSGPGQRAVSGPGQRPGQRACPPAPIPGAWRPWHAVPATRG